MHEVVEKRGTGRRTLILLLLVFISPILVAIYLYSIDYQPAQTKNYGEIVSPVREIPDFTAQDTKRNPVSRESFHKKWTLVIIGDGNCEQQCRENLVKIRQARLAQAGEALRIQYVYILMHEKPSESMQKLLLEHPKLRLITGRPDQIQKLAAVFDGQNDIRPANQVYMVDPVGRYMLRYPADFEARGLLKDLKYLMHWSQIG